LKISELIKPTERQKQAFATSLKHRFTLYGGRAGGGKSYFLRWWCLRELLRLYAATGIRGIRVGLFSQDYPILTDRQISKIAEEFPRWMGKVNKTQEDGLCFKLVPALGGGVIALRNLDDPSKYKSAEFAAIAVEELTENPAEVFDLLRFRLRWPGVSRPSFVAATNPGGIGHGWVKDIWVTGARDGDTSNFPRNMLKLFNEFAYVPAGVDDNPHLTREYRDDLQTLPEKMRRALADGDWDIFEGQYFTEWRSDVHVCAPFEIPWFWKVERCGDWGETNPCAHLWLATSPEGEKFVTGEVYGSGMKVRDQAEAIHAFERGKKVLPVGVLDSACWDPTGRTQSIAEQFGEFGVRWAKVQSKARVSGWQLVRTMLDFDRDDTGLVTRQPKLKVFSSCLNLIRTLPNLVHDKNHPEDLDSGGEDHAADALRYGLTGRGAPETPDSEMSPEDASFLARADKRYEELLCV
jgi:phage terminase large subunit